MTAAVEPRPVPPPARPRRTQPWLGDLLFRGLCQLSAALIIFLAVLILVVLTAKAWLAISTLGWSFFAGTKWDPEPTHRVFGSLAFIWGTVVTSVIAMLIAVPLGVGTAAYLAEIAPDSIRKVGSFFVEMLAAVPSVVYGFWGLFVLAPVVQRFFTAVGGPNQGGVGVLTAGIVLAIMIVPYVASVSYDVIRSVPRAQREGALALGSTRWQTIWNVVLPYARPGIVGGCFLALGRAVGETMAVTMLIGNKGVISLSPFALGNSIASVIANEFTEATYDLYLSALVELGLVLLLVSAIVNTLARVLIWRVSRPGARVFALWPTVAVGRPPSEDPEPPTPEPTAQDKVAIPPKREGWMPGPSPWNRVIDRVMTGVMGACLVVTAGALVLILSFLVFRGVGALNWAFFVNLPAPVGELGGGMANAIYGSALMVGMATAFAVPVGLLAAVYLAEYRSDYLGPTVRFIGELLAGVPSIVIGIFAYQLVVKPMGHFSGYAGAFALGVMMLPIVMRASEEALKLVPQTLREASFALGATHWQTVLRVTIPAALPAIITAVFLSIARVAGETAPLLLTASSNQYWPTSPGDFTPSLPVYIFTYAISPYADWHRQAWAAALVLVVVVMVMNFGVRLMAGRRGLSASRGD